MPRQLRYLALQAAREGQASHAHVHEIIAGLSRRGWSVVLHQPAYTGSPGATRRAVAFATAQAGLVARMVRDRTPLYIRAHFAALPTAAAARLLRIPVVQELNGPYDDLFNAWPSTRRFAPLFRWAARSQLEWADAVIVNTPGLHAWLENEIGPFEGAVIPNGANTELFCPEATTDRALPSTFVIFFGAFARWQGISTLCDAVECPEWPDDVHLVVAGDGLERRTVEDLARRNARVHYLGSVPYREMPGLVARSLAGLSPKNTSGGHLRMGLSPLKVYEILASGVPAIVTDIPGQVEIVREHECGIVIPPEDPVALARAVADLHANPELARAMGARGRQAVVEQHSWDRRAADTDALLERVWGVHVE